MILRYYGHSLFTLSLDSGLVLATDPYGDFYDYPKRTLRADVVTVSHHHHDHDSLDMIEGKPMVIDHEGSVSPARNLKVTGIPSKHDEVNGEKRGNNVIFRINAEGLTIVHLGDLGHLLTERQRLDIGPIDVLFTPVGGTYTTDAAIAYQNVRLLNPRVAIPMHYRTAFSQQMPISDEKPFLAFMRAEPQPMRLCRLTKGDLDERTPVVLMQVTIPATA